MSLSPEEHRRIHEAQAHALRARVATLEAAIDDYLRQGFRVISRTHMTAQLVKPYNPIGPYGPSVDGGLPGLLMFLVCWVLGWLDYHLLQKDRLTYLSLDADGQVLTGTTPPERIARERSDRPQSTSSGALATVSAGLFPDRQGMGMRSRVRKFRLLGYHFYVPATHLRRGFRNHGVHGS
jgi:hypothetical protein